MVYPGTQGLKQAINDFLNNNEAAAPLIETETAVNATTKVAKESLKRVQEELNNIKSILAKHNERQQQANRPGLSKGAEFFEALCKFDATKLIAALNHEDVIANAAVTLFKADCRKR